MFNASIQQLLTTSQRLVYADLETPLKAQISGLLSLPEGISAGQRVIKVIESCNKNLSSKYYHLFFQYLLELPTDSVKETLKELKKICKKNKGDDFFAFTRTDLKEYHTPDKLLALTTLFQASQTLKTKEQDPQDLSLVLSEFLSSQKSGSIIYANALNYLSRLEEGQRLCLNSYKMIFNQLESNTTLPFSAYERILILKLLVKVTSDPFSRLTTFYSLTELEEILKNFTFLHHQHGDEMVIFFCTSIEIVNNRSAKQLKRCLSLLNLLKDESACESLIEQFYEESISMKSFSAQLEKLLPDVSFNTYDEESFQSVQKRFSAEKNAIPSNIFAKMKIQYENIQHWCNEWKNLSLSEIVDLALNLQEEACKKDLSENSILQLIAIGRLALRIHTSKYAYNTQILTVLGMLYAYEGQNTFAQVKTGEGKSLITTLLAFVLVMQNKGLDIISSSRSLALRDSKGAAPFFKHFKILTSSISYDNQLAEHFKAHILYGTATDFEFAIMREKLGYRQLFVERTKLTSNANHFKNFESLIVDEADNLTFDTQRNKARLALPTDITFAWIYRPILNFVRIKDEVAVNEEAKISRMRSFLKIYMSGRFASQVDLLTSDELKELLKSAENALRFEENRHYTLVGPKENKSVVIVDADNTGCLVENSRWGQGLHEFIEAKHNLQIHDESLVSISLSHVVFYPLYTRMFGLTGTLGSDHEREELLKTYRLYCFDVPPHFSSLRKDLPISIFSSEVEANRERLRILTTMNKSLRPTLFLCDSILRCYERAEYIQKNSNLSVQILTGVQEESEEDLIAKAGHAGQITIATNLACRGTDICLDEKSIRNGGLHVILDFFPKSGRVEDQAKGRAGRQGQPGSSQIVLAQTNSNNFSYSELLINREFNNLIQSHMRLIRVELERYIANAFTNLFYKALSEFKAQFQSEMFVKEFVDKLTNISLLGTPKILVSDEKEVIIAQDLLTLFKKSTKDETDKVKMKEILYQMTSVIENKILFYWAKSFYKPLEALTVNSSEGQTVILAKAQVLFDDQSPLWNSYLVPSQAIVLFIKEAFNRDLSKLFKIKPIDLPPNYRLLSK